MQPQPLHLVVIDDEGEVSVCYNWLPSWMGLNAQLMTEFTQKLSEKYRGQVFMPDMVDAMDEFLLDTIAARFPHILGLRDFLKGLLSVRIE